MLKLQSYFILVWAIIALAILVAPGKCMAAQEGGTVMYKGKKVPHSLANAEERCAASNWVECHTPLSPRSKRK